MSKNTGARFEIAVDDSLAGVRLNPTRRARLPRPPTPQQAVDDHLVAGRRSNRLAARGP
jgi:hypothetical protein